MVGGSNVKLNDFRKKSKEELMKQLDALKHELFQLRVAKVTGGSSSRLMQIRTTRKDIARIHTIMSEQQRKQLRKAYHGNKLKPLDLRRRGTRAWRRRVRVREARARTVKQTKMAANFPKKKFALRV